MLLDAVLHRQGRSLQSVFLGGQHVNQLAATGDSRAHLLQCRIWQRAKGWPYDFGKAGKNPGVKCVGLRELPSGFRKISHLPGVDHNDR
jgi:hypothetical protein